MGEMKNIVACCQIEEQTDVRKSFTFANSSVGQLRCIIKINLFPSEISDTVWPTFTFCVVYIQTIFVYSVQREVDDTSIF